MLFLVAMVDQKLVDTVAALWRIPAPGPDNLLSAPEFIALADLCHTKYGGGNARFALHNAVQSLGIPCGQLQSSKYGEMAPEAAAVEIDSAYRRKTTLRRHLCPLDLSDDLPPLAFGSARVAQFGADELEKLFDAPRMARTFPRIPVEAKRLAQFQWLVVEETIQVDPRPEARAAPVLFMDLRRDLGEIDPHLGRFPAAVERALFFLLLAPWEDWSTMIEVDWRGFRTPWIHTIDDDIFVRPPRPPNPESLTLEPWFVEDAWGNELELERPTSYPLSDTAATELAEINDGAWRSLEQARTTPLLDAPIEHFLVRAFLSSGIDEVMAHMTAVEAAVGLESDYKPSVRPRPDAHKGLSPSDRVAWRVAGALNDKGAAQTYKDLFKVRSAFVHGRSGLQTISSNQRVSARRLARCLALSLVRMGKSDTRPRETILGDLLDQGRALP